jgi:hypothetical protein
MQFTPPSYALRQWFNYLQEFQSACSFNTNTNVEKMNLLKFANSKISVILPDANTQSAFCTKVAISPGFDISNQVLTGCDTFEALLDKFSWLPTYVGAYLQSLAADPYPAGSLTDFLNAPALSAFPGGSTGNQWQTAVGRLASVIPSVCFTPGFQSEVAASLDANGTKMNAVTSQIAVLG